MPESRHAKCEARSACHCRRPPKCCLNVSKRCFGDRSGEIGSLRAQASAEPQAGARRHASSHTVPDDAPAHYYSKSSWHERALEHLFNPDIVYWGAAGLHHSVCILSTDNKAYSTVLRSHEVNRKLLLGRAGSAWHGAPGGAQNIALYTALGLLLLFLIVLGAGISAGAARLRHRGKDRSLRKSNNRKVY